MAVVSTFPGQTFTSTTSYQVSEQTNVYYLNPSSGVDFGAVINGLLNGPGKRIVLSPGTFNLTHEIAVTYNNITIEGSNTGGTTLNIDDSSGNIGDGISFTNTSNGCVKNLEITSGSARTAGNAIHVTGGDSSLPLATYNLMDAAMRIENVSTSNQFNGFLVDNDEAGNKFNWRTYIRGGRHRNISANGCGIWINTAIGDVTEFGASHFIENVWIGDSSAAAMAGIRLTGTGDATLTGNEVFGTNMLYALLMDPPTGGFLTSVNVIGGFYDRATTACIRIAPHASVGRFGAINFNGVWAAGCTGGDVLQVVGAGAKRIEFNGCNLYSAGGSPGWVGVINAASYVKFIGGEIAGATTGGLNFTGSATNFNVHGVQFTAAGVGTGVVTLPIGIQIDAGCDHYSVTGNDLFDAGISTKITNTPGTSAARRIVQDNVTA